MATRDNALFDRLLHREKDEAQLRLVMATGIEPDSTPPEMAFNRSGLCHSSIRYP